MLRTTVVCAAVAALAVLMVVGPHPASAHSSYLMERARVLADGVLASSSSASERAEIDAARAAQEARDTLNAEVARREHDAEIADYANEHLAELGLQSLESAESDHASSFIQILNTAEEDSEDVSEIEAETLEAEAEEAEDAADAEEEEADAAEEQADAMEAAEDADKPKKNKKKSAAQRAKAAVSSAATSVVDAAKSAAKHISDTVNGAADTVAGPEIPNAAPGPVPLKHWVVRSEASDNYLKRARKAFEWADTSDGFPWHIKRTPLREYFSDPQIFGFSAFTSLIPNCLARLGSEVAGKRFKKFEEYPKEGTIGENPTWHTDHLFGLQRMKGVNPRSFRRAPASWDAFVHAVPKFKGTRQGVEHAIHNWTPTLSLDDAFAKGLMFYMDYKAVDVTNKPDVIARVNKEKQLIPAPIVLYYYAVQNIIENLAPVAIQTLQDFDPTKVVGIYYAPPVSGDRSSTYYEWRWAKLCVSQADFMYHEIGPHLAYTHLVQEIAIISAHRELPPLHPVHALIIDHSRKTLSLNNGARKLLVPHVFKFLDAPLDITVPTLTNLWAEYDFMKQLPHNDMADRGIDPKLLQGYHYANDSIALWTAIKDYTTAILKQTYADDAAVKGDPYVAGFVQEAHKIPGFPKSVDTLAALIDVVAGLQFIPTVQHSAVNYLQKFWGGFIPMEPSSLHGHHPAPGEKLDEKFLLDAMPTKFSIELHRETLKLLSQPTDEPITTHWGQYARQHERHLPGLGSGPIHAALIAAVNANTKLIETRSKTESAEKAYRVLEGPRIANSILI